MPDPMTRSLITSVEIENTGDEDRVRIWNRGRLAGALMVRAGDGMKIAELLIPKQEVASALQVDSRVRICALDVGDSE